MYVFVMSSPFSILLCVFLFPKPSFRLLFYFLVAVVKCRVAAVKQLSILHQSADYVFHFL